jgi:hypothetical protein
MLASISYRYLKEKHGVISGSGAQALSLETTHDGIVKKYLHRCALFLITRPPGSRLDLTGFVLEHYSFLMYHAFPLCPALKYFRILSKIFKTSLLCLITGPD